MGSTKSWKERFPRILLIDRSVGFPGANDLGERKPGLHHFETAELDEFAQVSGFRADEKRGAFRSKGIAAVGALCEEIESYQRVHNGAQSAGGVAGGLRQLLDSLGPGIEKIEDFIVNGSGQDQGWSVAPDHFHNAVGAYGGIGRSRHRFLWFLIMAPSEQKLKACATKTKLVA